MSNNYNGWTNHATWIVNVWFNPESKADVQMAREQLDEQHDELTNGPLKDMCYLSDVNWDELESHFDDEDEDEG